MDFLAESYFLSLSCGRFCSAEIVELDTRDWTVAQAAYWKKRLESVAVEGVFEETVF